MRESEGSSPRPDHTQGLKMLEENVLPCYDICKWLDTLAVDARHLRDGALSYSYTRHLRDSALRYS